MPPFRQAAARPFAHVGAGANRGGKITPAAATLPLFRMMD